MTKRAQWLTAAVLGVGALAVFRPTGGTAQQPVPQPVPPIIGTAQQPVPAVVGAVGGPKFTIVDTEGTNLLVVDNSSNTLYYYTVDPGKEVGDELKLRGSIDLNEVGRPVVKPRVAR